MTVFQLIIWYGHSHAYLFGVVYQKLECMEYHVKGLMCLYFLRMVMFNSHGTLPRHPAYLEYQQLKVKGKMKVNTDFLTLMAYIHWKLVVSQIGIKATLQWITLMPLCLRINVVIELCLIQRLAVNKSSYRMVVKKGLR